MIHRKTEYRVIYDFGYDVDHKSLSEIRKLLKQIPSDVTSIEKVTRYWRTDGQLMDELVDILFER